MVKFKHYILLMLLSFCSIATYAYSFEEGGIYYNITSSYSTKMTVSVTYKDKNYNSYSGIVVIPSDVTHNGITYSVTSIGISAFESCTELAYVAIPNSVTSIGDDAFDRCKSLTSITIPTSVTSIGDDAFIFCSNLASITIPNSVTSIGVSTFQGCSGLTSITIPNSVTSIGERAFCGCSSLTSVTIPNSVTSIGNSAFSNSGLTSVTIPNSVMSIGNWVFSECSLITSMTVEDGNPNYDSRNNCNAIIETSTNTLISGCQNTTIPNSVTSIGVSAFSYRSNLTSIIIPNSVTSIGNSAFSHSGLTSIIIPNSVTSIGEGAFESCHELSFVTIPNTVTSIQSETFAYCSSLTSVIIPNSVTSIGYKAFAGCSSLSSVTIPNSVTFIGVSAFRDCSNLTSVTIPNSVTSIQANAFEYCSNLVSVTNRAKKPQELIGGCFHRYGTLHVLKGYKDVYSNAYGWKNFKIVDDLDEVLVKGLIIDVDNQHFDINVSGLRAKATPTNEDADDWNVTWSTTTPSVMMVIPKTGDFMGLADGVGELVATANDGSGVVAKAKVYFGAAQPPTIQVASIDITAGKNEMAVGERQTLEATVLPTNASQKTITWSSTAPNIVSIDSYGEITALKSGTAIIIATATDGSGVSGICTITVKPAVDIDNINADDNSNDCNIYTINGLKVKGNNLPAGIYIKNGKKVVMK